MPPTLEQVYAHPVFTSLDQKKKHFMEAHFLRPRLNPFAHNLVHVAALTLRGIPHLKALPALQMMLEDFMNGRYENKHTLVVDSSGNTAHAVARLAQAFGLEVKVVLASDVPDSKVGLLKALSSVDLIVVSKGKSVAARAIEEAQRPGHIHLNQYTHMGNVRAHELLTGPEVLHALSRVPIGVIAIAMGSGGTATGVGRFLKRKFPGITVVGVCPKLGEQVPGARDRKRMADVVTLPWENVVDVVVEVSRKDAFVATRELWTAVEPQPGPTSGMAWKGLMSYLESLNDDGLEILRDKCAAFLCPDDGRFYSDLMIAELDTGQGFVS